MYIQTFPAIALGKLIAKITQILKIGGGSAAPGLYALKICPNLVFNLTRGVNKTIVITGTNGKTTTARMLARFASSQKLKVLRNTVGSNLERGVASTLIQAVSLSGQFKKNYDLAIWELDEADFNNVAPKLKPDIIVFLNVFRDQLDRYGEVDSVVKNWCRSLTYISPQAQIFINGDDHNLLELKKCFSGKIQTFGVKDYKIQGEKVVRKPEKGKLDFEAKNIKKGGLEQLSFSLHSQTFTLPVPGIYHIYNFLASYGCAQTLGIPAKIIKKSLKNFSPAFGRVEKFNLTEKNMGYIFLIKNPAGATQVFQTLAPELKPADSLLLVLNDNLADGTDVSWIWDADFEQLLSPSLRAQAKQSQIYVSGSRAEDLAVRLKYAGFPENTITIQNNLKKAFKETQMGLKGRLFILPTYTALLELQKILVSSGLKKHYWKEN